MGYGDPFITAGQFFLSRGPERDRQQNEALDRALRGRALDIQEQAQQREAERAQKWQEIQLAGMEHGWAKDMAETMDEGNLYDAEGVAPLVKNPYFRGRVQPVYRPKTESFEPTLQDAMGGTGSMLETAPIGYRVSPMVTPLTKAQIASLAAGTELTGAQTAGVKFDTADKQASQPLRFGALRADTSATLTNAAANRESAAAATARAATDRALADLERDKFEPWKKVQEATARAYGATFDLRTATEAKTYVEAARQQLGYRGAGNPTLVAQTAKEIQQQASGGVPVDPKVQEEIDRQSRIPATVSSPNGQPGAGLAPGDPGYVPKQSGGTTGGAR